MTSDFQLKQIVCVLNHSILFRILANAEYIHYRRVFLELRFLLIAHLMYQGIEQRPVPLKNNYKTESDAVIRFVVF